MSSSQSAHDNLIRCEWKLDPGSISGEAGPLPALGCFLMVGSPCVRTALSGYILDTAHLHPGAAVIPSSSQPRRAMDAVPDEVLLQIMQHVRDFRDLMAWRCVDKRVYHHLRGKLLMAFESTSDASNSQRQSMCLLWTECYYPQEGCMRLKRSLIPGCGPVPMLLQAE
jgi:hypothetical protein